MDMTTDRRLSERFHEESARQIDLVMASAMLALHRNDGWGAKRLGDAMDILQAAWFDCAEGRNLSMLQTLEDETGIELKPTGESKSFHELIYLDPDRAAAFDWHSLTPTQYIYMRNQQIKWIEPQVIASVFLTLHRKCGFGAERLTRLLGQIRDIQKQYNSSRGKILRTLEKETGVIFRDKVKE